MRENRPYGSEGGEAKSLPYPYQSGKIRHSLTTAPAHEIMITDEC
jgi:hypothetical protein